MLHKKIQTCLVRIASIVFSFFIFSSLSFAQISPNESLSRDIKSSIASPSSMCLLFIFQNKLTHVLVTTLSTYSLDRCDTNDYRELNVASINAQLENTHLKPSYVNRAGVYKFLADYYLIGVDERYIDLGKVKMSAIATTKISYLDFIFSSIKRKEGIFATKAYTPYISTEDTMYFWNAGSVVYELVSPEKKRYVMTSFSQEFIKSFENDSLKNLSSVLELPEGWTYEVRVLEKPLRLKSKATERLQVVRLFDSFANLYLLEP